MQAQRRSAGTDSDHIPPMSTAPAGFSIENDLPAGFAAFYRPLHEAFTARQQAALAARHRVLEASQSREKPRYLPPSEAQADWRGSRSPTGSVTSGTR